MFGAVAADPAGHDFAALSDEDPQGFDVLVINGLDMVSAETADFPAVEGLFLIATAGATATVAVVSAVAVIAIVSAIAAIAAVAIVSIIAIVRAASAIMLVRHAQLS
jgi:hypothetical protein